MLALLAVLQVAGAAADSLPTVTLAEALRRAHTALSTCPRAAT